MPFAPAQSAGAFNTPYSHGLDQLQAQNDRAFSMRQTFGGVAAHMGADIGGVLSTMADEISTLVQTSIRMGTEIPENMRPYIEELARSGQLLDENGEKIDFQKIAICVPTPKFEQVKNLLSKEQIASTAGTASESNPYAGSGIEVVHMPQLTDVNDWYLVATDLIQLVPPWIALKLNVPASLAQRVFDENSDFYKATGKIRYSSHIWYGFGLAFPQGIRKIAGA
jgi:hypothetical protein